MRYEPKFDNIQQKWRAVNVSVEGGGGGCGGYDRDDRRGGLATVVGY